MPKKRERATVQDTADSLAPQYPIESVDNALKLLLLLGEQPEIRLSEATRYLGVASSTAHRLLAMLAYRGFVRQDPVSKAYLPGPSLTGVAFAVFARIDIQRSAMPIMRGLAERLRETVHVGMLDGAGVRFVAAVEGPPRCGGIPAGPRHAGALHLDRQGHAGAAARAGAASAAAGRAAGTHHGFLDRQPDGMEAELAAIRERGYAINREESEEGVASVAVPIPTRAPGLRLALNAAAPVNRLDTSRYAAVVAALLKAAKEIGDQLS
ncbi:IclR family transcriptional regulator [Mycobacterium paraseoulense]|nr:IclR family transcriptional regulator [Mycobacterium paraseoulense]